MSESEWDALEVGDIVIERRSKTPRIVLNVTRSPRGWHTIEVVKLRRSKYPCPTTALDKYIWRTRLNVAHGRHARVRADWLYCEHHGWSHLPEYRGPIWCDPAYRKARGLEDTNNPAMPPAPQWTIRRAVNA